MFRIRPLTQHDIPNILKFTDREIGTGYFSASELEDIYKRSLLQDVMYSFVLEKNTSSHPNEIHGVRITFPPGQWQSGKGKGLKSDSWNIPIEHVGYFQSLFLSSEVQGQGYGIKLSRHSIDLLKKSGARAIATHAWKQSPNNSSLKYLSKLGFLEIYEHPNYWVDVNYVCTVDGNPCHCTAVEMLLKF